MTVDPTTPSGVSTRDIVEQFKYIVAPFAALGGWKGIAWLWQEWKEKRSGDRAELRQLSVEAETLKSTLDERAAAYMDRLEKANADLQLRIDAMAQEILGVRKYAHDEVDAAERERDVVYSIAIQYEEKAHNLRHEFNRIAQKYNFLIEMLQKVHKKEADIIVIAPYATSALEKEAEPITDLRSQLRSAMSAANQLAVAVSPSPNLGKGF